MTLMIDWISATTEATGALSVGYDSGYKQIIGPGGEIVNSLRNGFSVRDPSEDNEPSSSRNFRVFTPDERTIYISGNPNKLLNGHNLFGSHDLSGLYLEGGTFVRTHAALFPGPETWESCRFSKPRYSRIDLTRSYRFRTNAEARDFVRFVAGSARSRHGAASMQHDGTAYLGKHSRRWTLKIYCKHQEFVSSILPKRFQKSALSLLCFNDPQKASLLDWSQGVVRFELTLRGPELGWLNRMSEKSAVMPDHDQLMAVWSEYYNKITFNSNNAMHQKTIISLDGLRPAARPIYELWALGKDVRSICSKSAFYRYRSHILKVLDVDISIPPDQGNKEAKNAVLVDSGWDPEPLEMVEPRSSLKALYKLP